MKMRLVQLSLMLFVGLGLTGCIKISGEDTFQPNGSFVSEADFDFSALADLDTGLKELEAEKVNNEGTQEGEKTDEMDLENFCKETKTEAEKDKRYIIEDFECMEKEKGVFHVKITGKMSPDYLTIKNGVYTLKMKNDDLNVNMDGIGDTETGFSDEGLAIMKAMGMDITQTYTFPVPVTHADIGRIEGNKVIIGLEDFLKIGQQVQSGNKREFKIVAGGKKERASIRHHGSKGNSRLQQYHRQYLYPRLHRGQDATVKPRTVTKKITTQRMSARNHRSTRLRMKMNARRNNQKVEPSRVKKSYYHPFGSQKGRGYRSVR